MPETAGVFEAVVLGMVQGLTEMLPISSSGHLVLVPWLFGWDWAVTGTYALTFDVALHLGTLLSVIAFFWKDWMGLLAAFVRTVKKRKAEDFEEKMVWILAIATIPGIAAGLLLEDLAASSFREPIQIGVLLMLAGVVLFIADRWPERIKRKNPDALKDYEHIGAKQGLIIGLAQALAIMPGVSRSGVTMTAGLFAGLTRAAAARYSFLLSTPIILGAAIFQLRHLFGASAPTVDIAWVAGFVASAVFGFLAIKFLLRYVQTRTFTIFVVYRLVFGAGIIIIAFARG